MTSIVDVGYIMITQEGGEVLRVPDDVIALSQDSIADFKISNLPFVSTRQCKKDVKRTDILKHRLQFHPLDTPIPK